MSILIQTIQVTGDQVNFQVYIIPHGELTQCGHRQGMWNDAYGKTVIINLIDRQADTIQTGRTFRCNVAGQLFVCFKHKPF